MFVDREKKGLWKFPLIFDTLTSASSLTQSHFKQPWNVTVCEKREVIVAFHSNPHHFSQQ